MNFPENSSPDEDDVRRLLRDAGAGEPPLAADSYLLLGHGRRAFRKHRVRQLAAGSGGAVALAAIVLAVALPGSGKPEYSIQQPADGGGSFTPGLVSSSEPTPGRPTPAPVPATRAVPSAESAAPEPTAAPSVSPTAGPASVPGMPGVAPVPDQSRPAPAAAEPVPSAAPVPATRSYAEPATAAAPAPATSARPTARPVMTPAPVPPAEGK